MDPINPSSGGGYYPTPISGTDAASAAQASTDSTPTPAPVVPTPPQNDTVNISSKGSKASHYVQQARVLAPLDEATVKKLKAAIAEGKYPPPSLVQGLVNLVGNNIGSS